MNTYNLDDRDVSEINPSEKLGVTGVSGSEFNGTSLLRAESTCDSG